jgi:predicted O-methyltransferase YrrM
MKQFLPPEIEAYAHDHTRARPPLFDELRDYTQAKVPFPQMQVGRVEGTLLKLLASLLGARRILELGTYTGYSALCMAEAVPDDGEVITCDRSEEFTAVARSFWERSPHGHKIRLLLGDALDSIRSLDDRPLDMAFVDADKTRYPTYYEEIVPRLRPGGLLVVDNVLWNGDVLDPKDDDARAIATVNERANVDPRVENLMLAVRDGVLLVRKL